MKEGGREDGDKEGMEGRRSSPFSLRGGMSGRRWRRENKERRKVASERERGKITSEREKE